VISVFLLRALTAGIVLQLRKFLCHWAAEKPVIHASRIENNTLKG
jgi:hypothetical protein